MKPIISAAVMGGLFLCCAQPLSAEGLEENLTLNWTFGASAPAELSLSLRVEQPAEIGRALSAFLGTTPAATAVRIDAAPERRWLPALAQWDWRSKRGCRVQVNGVSLLSTASAARDADGKAAKDEPGMSRTTKILLGGAAIAAIGIAASGGHSSSSSNDTGGGGCSCPTCDGQVSAICSGNRLDDDGDCSTTCDTL
jgi:hypothetical protein